MNSDENDPKKPNLQKLVIFDESGSEEIERKDIPKVTEQIDQDYQIKLTTNLSPYHGKYRYVIDLINESAAPIKDIKIKVQYPHFLKIVRSKPPTLTHTIIQGDGEEVFINQVKIEFQTIEPKDKKEVILFFLPINYMQEGEIRTFAAYVNIGDYIRVLNSDPLNLQIKELTIQPKLIPSSEIASFVKDPNIRKAIKSIGVGTTKKLDYDFLFNRLEAILRANDFQLITKDKDKKILWYFGTDLESNSDLLVIGQIKEKKLEWIISSRNSLILISILMKLSHDLKKNLIRLGIINSEEELINLDCKACGAVLPKFPKQGKTIKCEYCKLDQVVW